jgi:hypothetical protein
MSCETRNPLEELSKVEFVMEVGKGGYPPTRFANDEISTATFVGYEGEHPN